MAEQKARILLVGASGIIGKAVYDALKPRYEIITAGLSTGDVRFDLTDIAEVKKVLAQLGTLDAVISTAGRANFVPLGQVEADDIEKSAYGLGLKDKLMGQVNLALAARSVLKDRGSIILTSGTTSDDPIIGGSSLSMVNGALEKWVMAAATEMERGIRINVVSPSLAIETPAQGLAAFPGFKAIPAADMALGYIRCLESGITGQTIRI